MYLNLDQQYLDCFNLKISVIPNYKIVDTYCLNLHPLMVGDKNTVSGYKKGGREMIVIPNPPGWFRLLFPFSV